MRAIEPIVKFDLAFSLFCLQHRFNHTFAHLSKVVSRTGDGHLYAVIGLLAWLFDGEHGQSFLMAGLTGYAVELPIYWLLKNSFQRRRPEEFSPLVTAYITPSDRFSLPSGHTTAGFLMATLIAYFYPSYGAFAFVWACLIGTSRLLLGVHFFTDVLMGSLLGITCAHFALLLLEKLS
jgi:undecaprenyl-diphosphatase